MRWWFDWQHTVNKRLIGEGTHNKAFLVTGADLPPDELFTVGYGLPVPDRGMIVRTGMVRTTGPDRKAPPTKAAHIKEMVTAAYAHAHGFGPVIYAQFYIGKRGDVQTFERTATPPGPWNAAVADFVPPGMMAGQIGATKATFTCTLRRRGKATARTRSAASHSTPTTNSIRTCLQRSLSPCVRARPTRASGTWTSSAPTCSTARPPTGRSSSALPTLTAISVASWRPKLRKASRHCCIAATAACFLGEIRCMESREAWLRFAGTIREAMKTEAGVDLDAITPAEWCFFLKTEQETKEVTQDDGTTRVLRQADLSWDLQTLGDRFRNHINNYFVDPADGNPDDRCFTFVRGQPLFPQIVEFAFVTQFP